MVTHKRGVATHNNVDRMLMDGPDQRGRVPMQDIDGTQRNWYATPPVVVDKQPTWLFICFFFLFFFLVLVFVGFC